METGRWWQVPRLHGEEEQETERRVSWLELFYDLVFVVVIAEVAHYLSGHLSLEGIAGYLLLFAAVWWAWIGGTFYNERFETQDISYRLITFCQMVPVAAMAIFAYNGLGTTSVQFILSYVAVRIVIVCMWVRAGWHVPRFRPVSRRYTIGFSTSIALLLISTQITPPLRFMLWAVALLLDLFTPAFTATYQTQLPRFSTSKLPERFGLFVLIVLGEAIVGVISGVAAKEDLTLVTGIALALGMALAFGLWWIYFDFIARRPFRAGFWWSVGWNYGHLPLVMSIAAIGAGLITLLESETSPESYQLIGGALGLALVAIGAIELTLRRDLDEPTDLRTSVLLKWAAAPFAVLLGAFGTQLGLIGFLACLLPLLWVQMAYGAYTWFTHSTPPAEQIEAEQVPT